MGVYALLLHKRPIGLQENGLCGSVFYTQYYTVEA